MRARFTKNWAFLLHSSEWCLFQVAVVLYRLAPVRLARQRVRNFSVPFTRALIYLIADSMWLLVSGKPCRRYSG